MRALLRAAARSSQLISTSTAATRLQSSWTCLSCRNRAQQTVNLPRRNSTPCRLYSNSITSAAAATTTRTQSPQDKPYYVTTPIFYVNAAPHVGHLYSMLLADVLKRWQTLRGEQAIFCTGTDEHGMKVQQAAQRQNMPPKALCDANSQTFRDLATVAKLDNDHFVRTTDPDHRAAVQYFWDRLVDSGYIYEKTHEGYYCVSDETYYPRDMVTVARNGMTGKVQYVSIETGNVVEWTEERNYHFRLTSLRDRLLEFFEEKPEWVTPPSRMAEVVDWVKNHLEDLSVSRPVSRLDWGIPVPGDESQTIYVWVDALVNYLTKAGYPLLPPGEEHKEGWPADVHVVGKDIVRFHCVYWPALLMAVGLPLPKRVLSHGHWLMDNRKMSKSVGNVVNPFFAIERYGVDTIRYFLILRGVVTNDPDYSNSHIVQAYKKGLQGGLGNLVSRITKGRMWSVPNAVRRRQPRGLEKTDDETMYRKLWQLSDQVAALADQSMTALAPPTALQRIMDVVYETNAYMAKTAPWDLAKSGNTDEMDKAVFLIAESVRICAILLQVFIPDKAKEILDRLAVRAERRGFEFARICADDAYGTEAAERKADPALFPALPVED